MHYRVWGDRDMLASFDDEAAALTFIGQHFEQDLMRDTVWLEVGDEDDAQLIRGEQLVERVRAAYPPDRLSA